MPALVTSFESHISMSSHMCEIKFCFFSSINLSWVNLIICSTKEPRKEGGKVFLPYSFGAQRRALPRLGTAWPEAAQLRASDKSWPKVRIPTVSASGISACRVQWKQEW